MGIRDAAIDSSEKATVAPTTSCGLITLRRAASSAPASEPTAITEPSIPYSPAPLSNTSRAISAVVIWKFSPNVPTTPISDMTRIRSGRCRT